MQFPGCAFSLLHSIHARNAESVSNLSLNLFNYTALFGQFTELLFPSMLYSSCFSPSLPYNLCLFFDVISFQILEEHSPSSVFC